MFDWKETNPAVVKKLEKYCHELLELNKDNISSINILKDTFHPDQSHTKLVVIIKNLEFSFLKNNLKHVSGGASKGIIAPLFLTIEHIESSADVFPIEFLDMKRRIVAIYGEDIFKNININHENLRLQCEQSLKGKLIRIRQAYLEIGLVEKSIKRLIEESYESLVPVFVGLLSLKGKEIPQREKDMLMLLEATFGIKNDVLIEADKMTFKLLKGIELEKFLSNYLDVILKYALAADKAL